MALRDTGEGFTIDPEDSAALLAWRARRFAVQQNLAVAQRQLAELDATLAGPAATAARAELDAADAALAQARTATVHAQDRFAAADAEAHRYEANELADARAAVDAATLAVSRTLAALLRDTAKSTSLSATVDGLALRDRYRTALASTPPHWSYATIPFPSTAADIVDPELALPLVDPADGSPYRQLLAVLDRLDDRVDGVADLVTAESVHQLVQGNTTRSGGSLAVAAQGRVPDEFDVIRTPRPGYDVVHRVVALLDPAAAPWRSTRPGPAARLDPISAAFAARLIPNPAMASAQVSMIGAGGSGGGTGPGGPGGGDGDSVPAGGGGDGGGDGDSGGGGTGGEVINPIGMPLDDLDLDPYGWIRVASSAAELARRLDDAARRRWQSINGPLPAGAQLIVDPNTVDPNTADPAPRITLTDVLAGARAAGLALGYARALDGPDLAHPADPDVPAPTTAAVAQVGQRVRDTESWLATLVSTLDGAGAVEPSTLPALLLAAASAGAAEAVPPAGVDDPDLLRGLAAAAADRLRPRLAATPFTADPADPAGSLARARDRAEQLAGVRVPVPAAFAPGLDATATADLGAGTTRLTGADHSAVRRWLLDQARVRTPVRAVTEALDLADALGTALPPDVRVTQLPVQPTDTWIGAAPAPRAGGVGIVVLAGYGNRLPDLVAGLVLDQWTQPVAADRHDTGVAFQYDQPDATPPQALLVAVHPDPDGSPPSWDLDTLLDVLTSTLDLARGRAAAAELYADAGIEVDDV
jgi:hypothetical protein